MTDGERKDKTETWQKVDCGVAAERGVVATSLFAKSAFGASQLRSNIFISWLSAEDAAGVLGDGEFFVCGNHNDRDL